MTVTINGATGETTPGTTFTGSTSGTILVQAASVAGTNTVTLPAGTGTAAVQGVSTNIVQGTAQASTSGTAITFTGIPSWVKRVTVMFKGVSGSGSSLIQVQIGAGSVQNTGYISSATSTTATPVVGSSTTGFVVIGQGSSASSVTGQFVLTNISGNIWIGSISGYAALNTPVCGGGTVTLSGVLDRVNITTINGTDTFDAGSINILYE